MSYPPPPQDPGWNPYAPQPPSAPQQQPNVYGSPDQPQPPPPGYSYAPQPWQQGAVPPAPGAPMPPPRKRTGLKVGLAVVGGLIVVGVIAAALGGGDGEPTADPTTTQSPAPSDDPTTPSSEPTTIEPAVEVIPDDTYYSFAALRDAYIAAGGECDDTLDPPEPGITAIFQAECVDGSVLALFTTNDDMLQQSSSLLELMADSDVIDGQLIISDTWTINPGDSVDVHHVMSVMGGVLVTEDDWADMEWDENSAADASQGDGVLDIEDPADYDTTMMLLEATWESTDSEGRESICWGVNNMGVDWAVDQFKEDQSYPYNEAALRDFFEETCS